MKIILFSICLLFILNLQAQGDSQIVKVHFYYGSKPKFKYRHTEGKRFGGLHGGHVSMEIGDSVFSFVFKGKVHIFAHRKELHSQWINEPINQWVKDTMNDKYATIIIPLANPEFQKLKTIQKNYTENNSYDYAFFGMRCAAATYDVFSQLGYYKKRNRFGMISKIFYPKLLRRKFFKMAKKNHWEVVKHGGSERRKWERR